MTVVRRLPGPLRRLLGRLIRWGRDVSADLAVIGPDDDIAHRFGSFGRGSALLSPQGVIYNERYITVGEDTLVGPNVAITAGMSPTQEMVTDPVVTIGSRCIIGRGSHIVGHWLIEIGDDIQTGPYVYITDQNHTYDDPDAPIGRQWPVEAAVRIGSGSWLGANVVILPGTVIGRNVVVAAGAVVSGEFPDRCVIGGVPAKVLRRYVDGEGWVRPEPDASRDLA
jgi:acetyltransferase-like isoleucine patch superfamily enzyme